MTRAIRIPSSSRALAACAAALAAWTSLAALPPTASAAPPGTGGPAAPGCWTVSEVLDFTAAERNRWTYTHTVAWCGDGTTVIASGPPIVEIDLHDPACAWQGVKDQWEQPSGAAWATFSMGEMVCQDGEGAEPYQLNPWVIVTSYPDGSHAIDKGIAGQPPPAGITG